MSSQPRGSKRRSTACATETLITAEFTVPSGECGSKDGVTVFPINAYRHLYPRPKTFNGKIDCGSKKAENYKSTPFCIRLDSNQATWNLDICHNWLYNLSLLRAHQNLIIDFAEESDVKLRDPGTRIVHPIIPVSMLETRIPKHKMKMTLTLEHKSTSDEKEILRSKQSAEKKNKPREILSKSDFRLKVDDEEFFVHLKKINAFSKELKATLEGNGGNSWDISDGITKDSIQALLQFIYYEKHDAINSQGVSLSLLNFCYKYEETSLFKICEEKLMKRNRDEKYVDEWGLTEFFKMYVICRATKEFETLKTFYGFILARTFNGLNKKNLKAVAESHELELTEELLKEIKQLTHRAYEELRM